jgi:hypothetical protein
MGKKKKRYDQVMGLMLQQQEQQQQHQQDQQDLAAAIVVDCLQLKLVGNGFLTSPSSSSRSRLPVVSSNSDHHWAPKIPIVRLVDVDALTLDVQNDELVFVLAVAMVGCDDTSGGVGIINRRYDRSFMHIATTKNEQHTHEEERCTSSFSNCNNSSSISNICGACGGSSDWYWKIIGVTMGQVEIAASSHHKTDAHGNNKNRISPSQRKQSMTLMRMKPGEVEVIPMRSLLCLRVRRTR